MTEKSGEQLCEEITNVIAGSKPDVVMLTLCSIICMVHRDRGLGSDSDLIDAVDKCLTTMLDEVPK